MKSCVWPVGQLAHGVRVPDLVEQARDRGTGGHGGMRVSRRARSPILSGMELLYTAHVPAGDGPLPTILLLHGWGASAHDLIGLAPILHGGRALVLCPQGPVALQPARA